MEWQVVVALAIAVPIILFPIAFVWFLNFGGISSAAREAKEKQIAREKAVSNPKPE